MLPVAALPPSLLEMLGPPQSSELIEARRQAAALLERALRERPERGSAAEALLLREVARLAVAMARLTLAQGLSARIDAAIDEMRERLVAAEVETQAPGRKVSLRLLQEAFARFSRLGQLVARLLGAVDPAVLGSALDVAAREPLALDATAADVLRAQLELLVALECLDGDEADLAHYARLASSSAMKLEGRLSELEHDLPGALLREQARGKWDDWTSNDVEAELAPWPAKA